MSDLNRARPDSYRSVKFKLLRACFLSHTHEIPFHDELSELSFFYKEHCERRGHWQRRGRRFWIGIDRIWIGIEESLFDRLLWPRWHPASRTRHHPMWEGSYSAHDAGTFKCLSVPSGFHDFGQIQQRMRECHIAEQSQDSITAVEPKLLWVRLD